MDDKLKRLKQAIEQDKRKSDRLSLPIEVFFSLLSSDDWFGPVSIDDISGHGLRFSCDKELDKGSELRLKVISADEPNPFFALGKVVRCEKEDTGFMVAIKFENMEHEERRRFVSYMCDKILLHKLKEEGD